MSDYTVEIPEWAECGPNSEHPHICTLTSKSGSDKFSVDFIQVDAVLPSAILALTDRMLVVEFGADIAAQWPMQQAKLVVQGMKPSGLLASFLEKRAALRSAPVRQVSFTLADSPADQGVV